MGLFDIVNNPSEIGGFLGRLFDPGAVAKKAQPMSPQAWGVPASGNGLSPSLDSSQRGARPPAASGPSQADWHNKYAISAAIDAAKESGLPGRVDGPGDAFRHLVWAAELTRRFGPKIAKSILDDHEQQGWITGLIRGGWSKEAEEMDRYNNAIGIQIGQQAASYGDILERVRGIVSATSPDGSGTWKDLRRPVPLKAPKWLPPHRWTGSQSQQSNWYDNPDHPGSLAFPDVWPHAKSYPFGGPEEKGKGEMSAGDWLELVTKSALEAGDMTMKQLSKPGNTNGRPLPEAPWVRPYRHQLRALPPDVNQSWR